MAEAVLDASAVLALLQGEPGADAVAETLPGAWISAANLAEVTGKLADVGASQAQIVDLLQGLDLQVAPLDTDQAMAVGMLRPKTRGAGLSLGDRCCLALAAAKGLPALTADRVWATLELDVDVVLVR